MFYSHSVGIIMINLPTSTVIKIPIAKQKIKKILTQKGSFKDFDKEVARCFIVNEISTNTININNPSNISNIYILHLILKGDNFSNKFIEHFTKNTKQHIIFIIQYNNGYKVAVYKEKILISDLLYDNIEITLKGFNLTNIWDNMIIDLFNINMSKNISLSEQILKDNEYKLMLTKLERLNKRMKKETQPLKKRDLFEQYNILKNKMEQLKNG